MATLPAHAHDSTDTEHHETPTETELKLLVPAGKFGEFRQRAIARLPVRNKGIVRRLEATYFDTADNDLYKAGLTLRVRRNGRAFTQTVKRVAATGTLSRCEWEAPAAGMVPDLATLPLQEIGAPLEGIDPKALVATFVTNVRRHALMLDLADAQIEIAFDDGKVASGAQQETISEVELELKQGRAASLYELGLDLMESEPLRLGIQTKSDRGYALACGATPRAVKAEPSGIEPGGIVDDAIATLLGNCQKQVLANLVAAESGTVPDAMHQLRVGLRRLRTLLWFLRREIGSPALAALENEAKQVASSLGPARNWDVFIDSTIPKLEKSGMEDIEFAGLKAAALPFRKEAYADVREVIGAASTNRFLLSIGLVIEQRSWRSEISSTKLAILSEPVSKFGARVLGRIERQAAKRGRHFSTLQPEQRHRLRITLKKLRYALEFFLPLYAGHSAPDEYLKRLSRLQDDLGADNDIATSRDLLHRLAGASSEPGVHRGIGAVIGWQRCHQLVEAKDLEKDWKKFKRGRLFSQ